MAAEVEIGVSGAVCVIVGIGAGSCRDVDVIVDALADACCGAARSLFGPFLVEVF